MPDLKAQPARLPYENEKGNGNVVLWKILFQGLLLSVREGSTKEGILWWAEGIASTDALSWETARLSIGRQTASQSLNPP